jgi:hypothetical protein
LEESVADLEDIDARDIVRASEDLDAEALAQSAERTATRALLRSAPDPPVPSRVESERAESEDLTAARQVAQSAADLTPAASIDNAIDQITAELAAFCFEQLERNVTSHDALDLNKDVTALEDELRVRRYTARRPYQYIQYLRFRSSRRSQITRRALPQT